ncbi:MAG: hypothetical protein QOF48_789, partial [Verrucomicrobiota bacterium]
MIRRRFNRKRPPRDPGAGSNAGARAQNFMRARIFATLTAALLCLGPLFLAAARAAIESPGAYGQLPAYFEANHGQADERFQFIARGRHHGVYLGPTEAVVALVRTNDAAPRFLTLTLVGANDRAGGGGEIPLAGTVHYFLGNDPARWQTGLPTFAQVRFPSVYPGIDLVYHNDEQQLEFDFIVAPAADPQRITLRFDGMEHLRLSPDGGI